VPKSRITVLVASDGLTARVSVSRGEAATEADLTHALSAADVVFGLEHDAVQALVIGLADPTYQAEPLLVARAQQPTLGVHGRFASTFESGIQPGHLRADGSMDFFDRELLKPIAEGQLLGELLPPRPGSAGYKVNGAPIPARAVQEGQLSIGSGVLCSATNQLHAARTGVLAYVANKSLDVVDRHTHASDVDLRSGHLDMQGALLVKKSVLRPFHVRATGDIEVLGSVDGGTVQAGGSVRIRGVVQGATSSVSSQGDASLRQAERCSVTCAGLLQLQSAVHCQLHAERIEVAGKLRGGTTQAALSVLAGQVDTAGSGDTLVAAAIPLPSREDALMSLTAGRAQRSASLRPGAFNQRDKGGKLGRASASLAADALARKLAQAAIRERLLTQAFVEVRGVAQAGVTIQLGAERLTLDRDVSATRFTMDPGTRSIRGERIER